MTGAENRRQRGSARDGAFKLVDGPKQNSALVRWSREKTSLKGCINYPMSVLYRVRMPECWPLHRTRLPTSVSVGITPQVDSYQHLVS